VECRRGSQDQAVAYCSKAESRVEGPWSYGKLRVDRRHTFELLAGRVRDGEPSSVVAQEAPQLYVRYARGLQALEQATFSPVWRDVSCFFIEGGTGCGKSSLVYDSLGYAGVYALASSSPLWFDGYEAQAALFIDEYSGDIAREALLRILDGHPYRAPVKGGFRMARWTCVIVVSNFDLWRSFDDATMRRFLGSVERPGGGIWKLVGRRGDHGLLGERLRAGVRGEPLSQAPPPPRQALLRPGGGGVGHGLSEARCGGQPLNWG
jgi:hypothetical protein